jgi:hypothetical protein
MKKKYWDKYQDAIVFSPFNLLMSLSATVANQTPKHQAKRD